MPGAQGSDPAGALIARKRRATTPTERVAMPYEFWIKWSARGARAYRMDRAVGKRIISLAKALEDEATGDAIRIDEPEW